MVPGQNGWRKNSYIHKDEIELWKDGGGARDFGFEFDSGPVPGNIIQDGDFLMLGETSFSVLHTPGHSRGHVSFYCPSESTIFCGDLIFYHSVGRTDLAVSNESDLFDSIRNKIFTLPTKTILYPGHGRPTTIQEEKTNNPFI